MVAISVGDQGPPVRDARGAVTASALPAQNLDGGIAQLKALSGKRNRPLPTGYLSDFINLQPEPFGAIFDTRRTQHPVRNVNRQRPAIRAWRTRHDWARARAHVRD